MSALSGIILHRYRYPHLGQMSMDHSPHVLYVEDNVDNRKLVSRLLSAYDFDIHVVPDGPAGLEYVQDKQPDLILMDINMPGMDGYTVIRKMRELPHLQTIPIVALTANVMKGDREKSLDAGCNGYIQKPISVDTFPSEVLAFLGNRSNP